jgi:hypothetical protein
MVRIFHGFQIISRWNRVPQYHTRQGSKLSAATWIIKHPVHNIQHIQQARTQSRWRFLEASPWRSERSATMCQEPNLKKTSQKGQAEGGYCIYLASASTIPEGSPASHKAEPQTRPISKMLAEFVARGGLVANNGCFACQRIYGSVAGFL